MIAWRIPSSLLVVSEGNYVWVTLCAGDGLGGQRVQTDRRQSPRRRPL